MAHFFPFFGPEYDNLHIFISFDKNNGFSENGSLFAYFCSDFCNEAPCRLDEWDPPEAGKRTKHDESHDAFSSTVEYL